METEMDVWFFTEQPYPQAWDAEGDSLRATLPNKYFDPRIGAELYNRYLDDWAACDDLGLNIMINEHHSSATCLTSSCTLPLAVLARITKKAKLLSLGIPLANRLDPVRVAEEIAYIDCLSRGRFNAGFVRGVPYEMAPTNSLPARTNERFWEAHDLILKALTTTDGPFNWTGDFYEYRQVNIWPRPYTQPHPKMWVSTGHATGVGKIAENGHTIACVFSGKNAANIFNAYRQRVAELGRPEPTKDKFAYVGLVGVGRTQEEGFQRLETVRGYLRTASKVAPALTNPPGYAPIAANVSALKTGQKTGRVAADFLKVVTRENKPVNMMTGTAEELIEGGLAFAGTPDQVTEQIKRFHENVGGMGNLIMMAQGGFLSHEDTIKNLALFSREVLPQIQDLKMPQDAAFEAREETRLRANAN
jgi:alkanesulfonate monooxygenase SsuD/methylene tetrahydromethanopterin reductase-like flavin-dependent oxidoreductase (luciferase family)